MPDFQDLAELRTYHVEHLKKLPPLRAAVDRYINPDSLKQGEDAESVVSDENDFATMQRAFNELREWSDDLLEIYAEERVLRGWWKKYLLIVGCDGGWPGEKLGHRGPTPSWLQPRLASLLETPLEVRAADSPSAYASFSGDTFTLRVNERVDPRFIGNALRTALSTFATAFKTEAMYEIREYPDGMQLTRGVVETVGP